MKLPSLRSLHRWLVCCSFFSSTTRISRWCQRIVKQISHVEMAKSNIALPYNTKRPIMIDRNILARRDRIYCSTTFVARRECSLQGFCWEELNKHSILTQTRLQVLSAICTSIWSRVLIYHNSQFIRRWLTHTIALGSNTLTPLLNPRCGLQNGPSNRNLPSASW